MSLLSRLSSGLKNKEFILSDTDIHEFKTPTREEVVQFLKCFEESINTNEITLKTNMAALKNFLHKVLFNIHKLGLATVMAVQKSNTARVVFILLLC